MRDTLTAEQAVQALATAPSGEGRWPRICDCTYAQTRGERGRVNVL
jgi:hypothetical protein